MEREALQMAIPINIYRSEDRLMVAALLPGLQPSDITIDVSADRHLLIRAELRGRLKDWKEVLVEEWQAGGASRDLELPATVDGASARATYEQGVLVVVLPLADSHSPGHFAPIAPGSSAS